ncbi:MAG TPA: sn-glycerol-3-phosphate ABC transporter ATP-binding protein UgpC [Corynebacterium xerosis]|uniref:ABC transporter ATP-binding protein n=1 Tax=Corynebacterium xerosis TaxID=1725 RepID=UPI001DA4B1A2|nr:sn-glycerol-3-phosphate ABC transporter ATP-binding protein UgpC [Corynebacterium xerosis]HJG57320.1 sn-glycerol-3-phosphate ABC transporter ATP-binding protein UgpC [Corynebacterium xerosis]
MAGVTFDGATRIFGKDGKPAVDSLDLDIADGEFLVLVGPSGCGKSTSLRMLAGLEPVDRGSIHIGGLDATGVRPQDRDVAMVFQNYALYPNMTVAQNMGFALRNQKVPKVDIDARVAEAARILQLEQLLHRKPAALSGGQRQRVAMGRAIVREPAVFCMDEPLSNLDAKLRVDTRGEISALQRRLGTTTVYVTHDQVEAMTMGDRVAVLYDGVLQQVDTPAGLYDRPVNAFVAGFMGSPSMNLLPGVVRGGDVVLDGGTVVAVRGGEAGAAGAGGSAGAGIHATGAVLEEGRRVTLGIRPEDVLIDANCAHPADRAAAIDVTQVEELGAESIIHGLGPGGAKIAVRRERGHGIAAGDGLRIVPDARRIHLFDGESGERIGD